MAQARVRGERLRWPSAGFRREPVIFFQYRGRDLNRRFVLCIEWLHPTKISLCRSMGGPVAEVLALEAMAKLSDSLKKTRVIA